MVAGLPYGNSSICIHVCIPFQNTKDPGVKRYTGGKMFSICGKSSFRRLALLSTLVLAACGGTPVDKTASTTTTATAPVITSDGTDFYLTLPDHICSSDPNSCVNATVNNKLIIASASATSGDVTFNGVSTPYSVNAGSSIEISLDAGVVLTSNETVESKGIHVTALTPVSVHVVSENTSSADGYLALPTNGLGTSYRVMSYASSRYNGSEFAIVASQDSTTVTITPTAAGATQAAGTAYTISLNSGQTYQLQNPAYADMTGSLITSDKPIAVFGGHRCADIPNGTGYCDYLVEQLPDTSVWGNTFQTMPFSGRTRYTVRILASMDGTTITSNPAGLVTTTLNAGQYADVLLSAPAEFSANNPVLVAQFINGFADDSAKEGDPSMVLITPTEMGMTSSTFGVHGLTGSNGSMMNIVTETSALANLTLDGATVDATLFAPVNSGSLYSKATLPVSAGVHVLTGSVPYSAMVYDYGITWNAVSYAYPVATMLSLPVAAAPANTATPTSGCTEEEDEHHHWHRRRHEHQHHQGEYCLIHHTSHRHDGADHEYECNS
jgi:hypothetical protein